MISIAGFEPFSRSRHNVRPCPVGVTTFLAARTKPRTLTGSGAFVSLHKRSEIGVNSGTVLTGRENLTNRKMAGAFIKPVAER